jgi:phospholipase/carboxylesterase
LRIETLGGLKTRIVGSGGGSDGDGPLVVLLHGFGAPGGDLVPLADVLEAPRGTRFAFPEAPLELPWGFDSRAWWLVDMERLDRALRTGAHREMSREVPDGLVEARGKLEAMLAEAMAQLGAVPSRTVVGGFSQGSMLACDMSLRAAEGPAGLVLMSTTILAEDEWMPLVARSAGLPVLMSHGTDDPLLPFSAAERLRDAFLAAGARVTWVPFRGAHEIPHVVIAETSKFLNDVLA